jgi:hypothetical protein
VSNLLFSLLIGALVAGATFVAVDKLRSLIDAGSAEFAAVSRPRSLVQTGLDNESQGQHSVSNPYKQLGIKIAFGIPVLAVLFYLVWPYHALYDLFVAAREHATDLEEQILGPTDAGFALGSGAAASAPTFGDGGQSYTETTISGGRTEIINHAVPEYAPSYALPFRGYRWHQPVERRVPDLANRWGGERHGGVEWRRATSSFPTTVSRPPTMASRSPAVASRPRR